VDFSRRRQSIRTCEKTNSPLTPVVDLPAAKKLIDNGSSTFF
jgi:hypothetical protein